MSVDQIISSGLLELYVIDDLSQSEKLLVEEAIEKNESIRHEIFEIESALEEYALKHAIPVSPTAKPMFFAGLDYTHRLQNGEIPISAPSLSPTSKASDYSQWLEREDLQAPEEYDSAFGKIINSDHEKTTMIIWLKDGAPDEVHTDEFEKFLIIEGSCNIKIADTVHSLQPGDYLAIPLFVNHSVEVTSTSPCKIILERAAA